MMNFTCYIPSYTYCTFGQTDKWNHYMDIAVEQSWFNKICSDPLDDISLKKQAPNLTDGIVIFAIMQLEIKLCAWREVLLQRIKVLYCFHASFQA